MPRNAFDIRNAAIAGRTGAPVISSAGVVPYGNIAQQANQFMTGQAVAPLIANLPNYNAMTQQSSGNILSNLRGQVPEDVVRLLQQKAAERGAMTGMAPDSPNLNASYLQALGLTSLDLMGRGEQQLSGAVERTPMPQPLNPASLFVPQMNAQQELMQAQMGGAYRQPGGQQIVGSSGLGRSNPNYGRTATTPAGGGGYNPFQPSHTATSMNVMPTEDAVSQIANGNFNYTGAGQSQGDGQFKTPFYNILNTAGNIIDDEFFYPDYDPNYRLSPSFDDLYQTNRVYDPRQQLSPDMPMMWPYQSTEPLFDPGAGQF